MAVLQRISSRLFPLHDGLGRFAPGGHRPGRAIGVTSLKRSPAFPELPTISEAGVPGFEVITWSGVVVPAGVPKALVARLNAEINKALTSPAAKERLAGSGYELVGGTPEQFTELVKKEMTKWADVVKRTGAKVD